MTPAQYAKTKVINGELPSMKIEKGNFGAFWLHDADYKMLKCNAFISREAAEKYRSKVIETAVRKYA